jgi:hypothetical protein
VEQVINLLGKTVKFLHTEDEKLLEISGKVTDVVLNLEGDNQISINNDEFYILSDLLEFEIA